MGIQPNKQATILPRPRRPEEVMQEIPGSCSSTRRLMQGTDEMSGPCSSLSQDAHPTMDSTIGSTFDSSGNQFFTLPTSSRPPVVTCGMGSLKKVISSTRTSSPGTTLSDT